MLSWWKENILAPKGTRHWRERLGASLGMLGIIGSLGLCIVSFANIKYDFLVGYYQLYFTGLLFFLTLVIFGGRMLLKGQKQRHKAEIEAEMEAHRKSMEQILQYDLWRGYPDETTQ